VSKCAAGAQRFKVKKKAPVEDLPGPFSLLKTLDSTQQAQLDQKGAAAGL
jgi:hypothetical protein